VGYDRLEQRNPRLVFASLSGFGQTGPYRDRAAHDLNYLALAGVLGYNVDAAGTPVLPAVPPADLGGGALAALAILAAVIGRGQTGRGQALDVSLFGSAVALLPTLIAPLFSAGQPAPPGTPILAGGLAQYAVYRTADGRFLSVGALEPHLWQNFLAAVDRLDLLPLATGAAAEQATLRTELAALFASRPLRTWLSDLAGVDTCVAPVQTLTETLADPHVDAQGLVGSVTHPRLGPLHQLSPPFSLSDTPARIERPPPDLGADTDAVLAESHFTPAEIAALHASHTI
jgi:crotonobetainyl-CoA:carnitine CoA-transferase CaiB-like acyl-CoA transferase